MNYIRHSLEHLNNNPNFEWNAKNHLDWKRSPSNWVQTRYEQKAIEKRKRPIYLTFYKKT